MTLYSQPQTLVAIIVGVILAVAILAYLVYTNRIPQAKKIVLALVIEAEKSFDVKTGKAKLSYVLGLAYPKLPTSVRLFITQEKLQDMIEEAVSYLNDNLKASLSTTTNVSTDIVETPTVTSEVEEKPADEVVDKEDTEINPT